MDVPASRRSRTWRIRHDLDEYLWFLDDSLRSLCCRDSTFKTLPNSRFAMEAMIPHDTVLDRDEFAYMEKLWSSFVTTKKFEWKTTSPFLVRLRNEGLDDLHRVLQAPILKADVGRTQLHVDVHSLSVDALKKDFEARSELAYLVGLVAHMTLLAADQAETIKFVPEGQVASHLSKICAGMSVLLF